MFSLSVDRLVEPRPEHGVAGKTLILIETPTGIWRSVVEDGETVSRKLMSYTASKVDANSSHPHG